jgi:hypothetical protein
MKRLVPKSSRRQCGQGALASSLETTHYVLSALLAFCYLDVTLCVCSPTGSHISTETLSW